MFKYALQKQGKFTHLIEEEEKERKKIYIYIHSSTFSPVGYFTGSLNQRSDNRPWFITAKLYFHIIRIC